MRTRSERLRRAVPALLVLALLVRVLFVVATPNYVPHHDDRDYDRLACWVAEHGAYPDRSPAMPGRASCVTHASTGAPTAYRPPLWPVTLGATYAVADAVGVPRWTAGRLVQALLGTAIVALAGAIAAAVWGRATALVTLGLGAVCIPLVLDGTTLISEPLFVVLELAAALTVIRHRGHPDRLRWAIAAGVLVGLAALTRSTGTVLGLAILIGLWTGAGLRPLLAVASFAVTALLVITPWAVRNERVLGAFVPVSTEVGPTLLGTYNPAARADPGCTGCWILLSRTPGEIALARRLLRLTEIERDRESRSLAVDFMRHDPGYVAQVAWQNSLRLLELGGAGRTRFTAGSIDVSPGAAVIGAWQLWLLLVLGIAGAACGTLRRVPRWLLVFPAILWVATVLVQSETPRFRAPIDPFVVMLAAAAPFGLRERFPAALRRPVVAARRPLRRSQSHR